jgi:tetratricopeptide (TPR) repeat protein
VTEPSGSAPPPPGAGEPDCPPTLPVDPGAAAGRLSRFTALRPGSLFAGRYELGPRLGAGGAGEVYRAVDRVAGQPVALKVLFPRGDDGPEPLARLQRELRIARRVHHPGLVRVHDIGEHDGLLFLVMDLLDGETLRERLRREPRLPPDEAERVLRGLLEALAALHAEGGLHRDVKPANVFLAKELQPSGLAARGPGPEAGRGPETVRALAPPRVVLLDFGLARAADEQALTATGQFVGTPEYVSPEQARGERSVAAASDVYSAGIVLWEMLAGAPPFTGDSAVEILAAHLRRPVPEPRRAMPGAPARLRRLAAWMVEKEPARRPPDATAALAALEAGGAPRAAELARWLRPRRRRLALGAAGALGALALAAAILLPVGIRIDDGALAAVSAAGHRVRTFDFATAQAVRAIPWSADARWPREWLIQLNRPGNAMPAPFVSALARVDLLRAGAEPFAPPGLLDRATGRFPAFFPRFGADFGGGEQLLALPSTGEAEPRFAASFKQDEYPALLSIFSSRQVDLLTPHPGWIWDLAFVAPSAPGARALLAAAAQNHPLGQRLAVFAVPANGPLSSARVAFPPFELDLSSPGEATFYTLLSRCGTASLAVRGDRLEVDGDDGSTTVLDARTGVPIEPKDRDGLTPGEWQSGQQELLERLLVAGRASAAAGEAPVDAAAGALEEFAARARLGRAQRGVALARAAQLRMRQGRDAEALALVERAVALEPEVAGHYRLRIDLLARLGRWPDAVRTLAESPAVVAGTDPVKFELVVAGLASGQVDGVRALLADRLERPRFGSDYFDHLASALVELQRGRGEKAARHLDEIPRSRVMPNFAFFWALAEATRDAPDPAELRFFLDVARAWNGAGHCPPFASLEALADALDGRTSTSPDAIAAELEALRRAARESVLDRWYLAWIEAFAGRATRTAAGSPPRTAAPHSPSSPGPPLPR